MSSPIASSPYVCRTPTDILKCVLHMSREKNISIVISHADLKKRSLLLWNSYSTAGQHIIKTTQSVNIHTNKFVINIVIHSATKIIPWRMALESKKKKKDKEILIIVLISSQNSVAKGCESILFKPVIVS